MTIWEVNNSMDKIELIRTYDTVVILMAAMDTSCPVWLKPELQNLIGECFDKLPDVLTIDNGCEE